MYRIEVKRRAAKVIDSLSKKDQQRIAEAFEVLRRDPFAGKKLEGEFEGARSIRVWPYRILYAIFEEIVTVVVFRVGHRKDVYRP